MKKLILSAGIILASLTGFAQTAAPVATTTMAKAEKTVKAAVLPSQEKFTEIKTEETPDAVVKALKKDYPNAVVSKVYVNEKKDYKIDLTVDDQKTTVYTDVNGYWIKK